MYIKSKQIKSFLFYHKIIEKEILFKVFMGMYDDNYFENINIIEWKIAFFLYIFKFY